MILSERIRLRAIEKEDIQTYYQWINDPDTNYWRGLYHPMSVSECETYLNELKITSASQLSLVIETHNSEAIGLVGLRSICNRSRRAELWIYIGAKAFWNKKYGQESLSTLTKYAFEEMNLHRIWLECDPEFEQSVNCYKHIGFQIEGTLKDGYFRHGKYRDTLIMGLLSQRK